MQKCVCDICGTTVKSNFDLNLLQSPYRTNDVQEVCKDCLNKLDAQHNKVSKFTRNFLFEKMKIFISNMKNNATQ